jgi:amidohydrolase
VDDEEFVRRVRRAVHRRPELGHQEWRTANYVERLLRRFGLTPFRPAPTSVAVVVGAADRPVVLGFRCDLDAIAGRETTGRPFTSRNPGVVHACGHDGHVAVGLGLARRLARTPPGAVRVLLVFQQAEESYPSGAPMVLAGLPRESAPREFLALHLWPELPAGSVGVRSGPVLASVSGLTVRVDGAPGRGHGTRCARDAVDALAVGVRLYDRLSARWPGRHPTDGRPAALTVGRLTGGHAPNQVPLECRIEATLRALSWADETAAIDEVRGWLAEQEAATGARISLAVESGIRPPVVNSAATARRVVRACARHGVPCLDYPAEPVGVSEDFGWMLSDTPGALVFLGCGGAFDLHSPEFDFDESVLLTGLDVVEAVVRAADDGSGDAGR